MDESAAPRPIPVDDPDVSDVRPSGSIDDVRDEVLPIISMPTSVRSVALTVLTVIAATWALYVMRTLLVPLLLGIIISLVLSPLVDGLQRIRLPRALGAALVLMMLVGTVGTFGYHVSEPASALADDLPRVARRVREAIVRTAADQQSAVANLQEAADELTAAPAAAPREGRRSGAGGP